MSKVTSSCSVESKSTDFPSSSYRTYSSSPGFARASLSDQTLLMQAFRGSVNVRKTAARDWLVDRVDDISDAESQSSPAKKDKGYSSKIRSLMHKLKFSKPVTGAGAR